MQTQSWKQQVVVLLVVTVRILLDIEAQCWWWQAGGEFQAEELVSLREIQRAGEHTYMFYKA